MVVYPDHGVVHRLTPGETLFEFDDLSSSVFFVVEGNLEVIAPTAHGDLVVGRLAAGDPVGEISAVLGGRRMATVRATTEVVLTELDRDAFGQWLDDNPAEAQLLTRRARERIDRTRAASVLTELIGPGSTKIVADVCNQLDWIRLDAGERLFSQGDTADAAYIVVAGRIQLVGTRDGKTVFDAMVGRGDVLGELGIVDHAPRAATAIAVRDSTLARLSVSAFEQLTAEHPTLMLQLFRRILTRVMRPPATLMYAGSIAVSVLSPNVDPKIVVEFAAEIERHGATLFLNRARLSQLFDRGNPADADTGTPGHARLNEFLHEAEVAYRWVILQTDATMTRWSARALRGADRVVLITSPYPDEAERAKIAEFARNARREARREVWVVQANAATIASPRQNHELTTLATANRCLHLRRGDPASTRRVARLISGTATGVALSGGGGRGFAHLGALRALEEFGVPIDAISGTSMGSLVAASMAAHERSAAVLEHLVDAFETTSFMDYTIPIVSLTTGRAITDAFDRMWGPARIEDLWLPFVCLSTNLTAALRVEHRSGRISEALRASVSLPGVFPPVVAGSDLLVDGGVLENLPVSPLAADPAVGTIIAIDVAPQRGPQAHLDYGAAISGPAAIRSQLRHKSMRYPQLAQTVMSSMLLGSLSARTAAIDSGRIDLYLKLDLSDVKLLEFRDLRDIARRGYHSAIPLIEAWMSTRQGGQITCDTMVGAGLDKLPKYPNGDPH